MIPIDVLTFSCFLDVFVPIICYEKDVAEKAASESFNDIKIIILKFIISFGEPLEKRQPRNRKRRKKTIHKNLLIVQEPFLGRESKFSLNKMIDDIL